MIGLSFSFPICRRGPISCAPDGCLSYPMALCSGSSPEGSLRRACRIEWGEVREGNGQARPKGSGQLAGSDRQGEAAETQAVRVTAERPQQGDRSESMQLRTGPRMRRHAG